MSEKLDVKAAAARLFAVDDVLIICHKNPDGDTLGSAGALYHGLVAKGKNCAVLCADDIHPRYDYLQLRLYDESFEPKYIIAVDLAGPQLFGDVTAKYAPLCDLCIDHHASNTGYAKALLLEEDSSCAEVVLKVLDEMNVTITKEIANCLYTGISTDTGCFKFTNTTANTHLAAARLMDLGADTVQLNQLLFESKSRSRLEIERLALSTLEFHFEDKCALIYITREMVQVTGADGTDMEGITGIPRSIEGVGIGITMRQQTGSSYKVSVRTTSEYSAADICARLGGGGHRQAAGCEMIGNLENAKAAILAEAKKELCK